MWQFLAAALGQIILALENSTALFPAGFKLHLYTNNVTPTQASLLADFTELTNVEVPGYAAASPAWNGTPYRNQDGSWVDYQSVADFVASAVPPSPQVVFGWFVTDSAATVLVAAGLLAQPFTYAQAGDGFGLEGQMKVVQESSSDYGVNLTYEQQ
jgi:hypothetical protein